MLNNVLRELREDPEGFGGRLWLASGAADGVTGQRFNASRWNPGVSEAAAAANAVEPGGWVPAA